MAAAVHHPAAQLANIQRFAAWVKARDRTMPWANAAHKEDASTIIIFQVIDIGLEPRCKSSRDTGTRACFERCNDPRRVTVGVNDLFAMFVVFIILIILRATHGWNVLGMHRIRSVRLEPPALITIAGRDVVLATV